MSRPLSDQKFRRAHFTRLKERKAEITRLREERGATDPILIIAGIAITLILLVGGSFAISGFIANANNLNAKGDLDRIATAQAAYLASNDRYGALSVGPNISAQNTELQNAPISFTPTAGNSTIVRTSASGWVAVTKSASGAAFVRSSASSASLEVPGSMVPAAASYTPWVTERTNLAFNPDASTQGFLSRAGSSTALMTSTNSTAPGRSGMVYRQDISAARASGTGALVRAEVTSGSTVRWSLWVYSTRAGVATVYAEGFRNGTYSGMSSGTVNIPANTWTQVTGTGTLPSGTLTDWKFGMYNLQVQPGDVVYYDDFLVEENTPNLGSFFSGSLANTDPLVQYLWTGAVNGSASVLQTRTQSNVGAQVWSPGEQPAGLVLPSGITWGQVANDLQDVFS